MCADCAREYDDPANRRFRAEPIACPKCGPRAWLESLGDARGGADSETDYVEQAAALVRHGGVIAILGLGGAHLACDASSEEAVERMREIKRREHKPLAVMVESIESARTLAVLAHCDETLLDSPAAPIILVQKRPDSPLAPSIAPGTDQVGLMLAYTPLHYLLMRDAARPLVMTSANLPGEPLCRTAEELRLKFGASVDAILLHDRPIHQRCDDGVWMNVRGTPQPIRASRGSTPRAISIPLDATLPILAVGGDIKNSFCLLSGNRALMSQYIGTLEDVATREHFLDSLSRWKTLVGSDPQLVAHDLHPSSSSRALAESLGLPTVAVQHHHAHIAACLAENGESGPGIGIAFDGTGYGVDGAIWGGEALLVDLSSFKRIAHLEYLPLPGGDAAIRHPARVAAAYLLAQFGELRVARIGDVLGRERVRILERMIERGINTVRTSSVGRLFDAVAALVGVRDEVTYEAQAAIELEALARSVESDVSYPFSVESGAVILKSLLAAIISDARASVSCATIARRFHSTMVEIVGAMAELVRRETGTSIVALSGGCFQNRLLLDTSIARLESDGFRVLTHHRVPANDGGLALGQAVIAAGRASGE
jgi:hydrogenase maturation protein HypF